jgi:hypothetical protein
MRTITVTFNGWIVTIAYPYSKYLTLQAPTTFILKKFQRRQQLLVKPATMDDLARFIIDQAETVKVMVQDQRTGEGIELTKTIEPE